MMLARVEGSVIATRKHPSFNGVAVLLSASPLVNLASPKGGRWWHWILSEPECIRELFFPPMAQPPGLAVKDPISPRSDDDCGHHR